MSSLGRCSCRSAFQGTSEGHAASDTEDSADPYSCLTYLGFDSRRDGLDAVSCASRFNGDKGRYLTPADVAAGYAEPEQLSPIAGGWRALSVTSAYPPRRDLAPDPLDSPDFARFGEDALLAMPELDAVTMATLPAEALTVRTWLVPEDWPAGAATVSVEINTEGDYNSVYDPTSDPTPTLPEGAWDPFSQGWGYPYRGQPSVVFDVQIEIPRRDIVTPDATFSARTPSRLGALDASLTTRPIDETITDEPSAAPGSGADRLRRDGADRVRVRVLVRQLTCRHSWPPPAINQPEASPLPRLKAPRRPAPSRWSP